MKHASKTSEMKSKLINIRKPKYFSNANKHYEHIMFIIKNIYCMSFDKLLLICKLHYNRA